MKMKTRRRSVCFFAILFLMANCRLSYGQFHGGLADGHTDTKLTNVVCVVINTNPFSGGAGDGVSNTRLVNITCTVVNSNPFAGGFGDGAGDLNLTNVTCTPVNANPFLGGISDGHSDLNLTNVVCIPVNANPFLGGIGDGHSDLNLTNVVCVTVNANPFLGGNGDGASDTSVINITCTLVNTNPFAGGIGDGHSNLRLTNVTCTVVNVNPFVGGFADGFAMANVQNVTCIPINVNPFKGGFADGHANMRMVNTICSVVNVNPFHGGVATGFSFNSLTNIMCGVASLPIQLIFFEAKPDGNKVVLNWETASEINSNYFTVEKSKVDNAFEKVVNVDGAGNSNHYSFYETADENPFHGVSYYRLRQTDFDGLYSFSRTVEVNINQKTVTAISPNPVTDNEAIMLSYETSTDEQISIKIRDALGVTVCSFFKSALKGSNSFLFSAPDLHNGLYFVDVCSSSKTETLKLMVDN